MVDVNFTHFMPTRIFFGPKSLEKLRGERLPGKKALIVISAGGSMVRYGYLGRLTGILESKGIDYTVFDKILPHPIRKHVMEGARVAREEKCDFVIGLGGGSSIDSAKSIALMARNDGDYWDYIIGGTGKGEPVKNGALPIVAITTTAGTGTEADPWTVITNEETKEKIGYGNDYTFPTLSVVDPELMLTVPPHLTAFQGFDALFHSVEGYIANVANPMSDLYALKSVELIARHLPVAVKDGQNLEARTYMALANTLAGFVESTSSCTSEHSMEHALSAFYPNIPHGAGLIMLSEAYHTFFAERVPERYINLAQVMGVDVEAFPEEERPYAFIKALRKLQEDCGVGNLKMSEYGIKEDEIEKLAENAIDTMGGLFEKDPCRLSFEETVKIMKRAYR